MSVDCIRLTDDHVYPLQLAQMRSVLDDVFIRRQHDLKVSHPQLLLQLSSLGWVSFVCDHLDGRRPLGEFSGPVSHGRERDNDEIRPPLLFHFNQEGDKGDRLDGFAETLTESRSQIT